MTSNVRTTWRLLRPHAKGHLWAFLLVFLFGALAALGERSVLLLLTPTFEALFGEGGDEGELRQVIAGLFCAANPGVDRCSRFVPDDLDLAQLIA